MVGLVLALALLPTWNLPHAKGRILRALAQALGRRVTADEVHLVVLPWPGVELINLHVAEAPPFGAEDMLTAETARATLRLFSLWSGRLEFSTVRLEYPSLNVVHAAAPGVGWNVASLLDTASARGPRLRATTAGSSLRQSLVAPVRFPYIEFVHGRVNFKNGWTKARVYLEELEGSVALEQNDWRVHARFAPARTDVSLTNGGNVTVDGTFAAARQPLRELPFDLTVRVQNAYLPAVSDLVWGRDRGVYGIANLVARLQGNGRSFQMTGTLQADALRRWDLLPPPVSINAGFVATYDIAADRLTIRDLGDTAGAHVTVGGQVAHLLQAPQLDLHAAFRQLPAADLLMLMRAVKANLPPDLIATGSFDGAVAVGPPGPTAGAAGAAWTGWLRGQNVALQTNAEQVQVPMLQAVLGGSGYRPHWTIPLTAALVSSGGKRQSPVAMGGTLDTQGFQVQFAGAAVSADTWTSLAHLWGFDSPWNNTLQGVARLACAVGATWNTFRQPQWSGEILMPSASYTLRAGLAPLVLTPLRLRLGVPSEPTPPDAAAPPPLSWVRGDFTGAWREVKFDGWVSWPLGAASVPTRFNLHVAHVTHPDAVAYFSAYLTPPPGGLLRLFSSAPVARWPNRPAQGTLQVDDWEIGGVPAQVQANLQIAERPGEGSAWEVSQLDIGVAGGHFAGTASLNGGELSVAGAASGLHLETWAAERQGAGLAADARGRLSGTIKFSCPVSSDAATWHADGEAVLEQGQVPVVEDGLSRTVPVRRLATPYQLRQGVIACHGGRWWRRRGPAPLDAHIDLQPRPWVIRATAPLPPPSPALPSRPGRR